MNDWIKEIFGTEKPVIAMCHFGALPGDPAYDSNGGIDKVTELAGKDLRALQEGGVDAVMFSNEFSMPYLKKVHPETTAAMAYIIGALKQEIRIPFGVNVLWDPYACMDLSAATGALFIREIMSGVYASDFGLWDTNTGEIVRHQMNLGLKNLKRLFNIVPEASSPLGNREIGAVAKTTVFNCKPDVICVSGATAGVATDMSVLEKVKNSIPSTPVFANTGCRADTIGNIFKIADGCIVGTTFKEDGLFENHVDPDRVKRFMDAAVRARN